MADNFGSSFSDAFSTQQKIGIAEQAQRQEADFKQQAMVEKHIGDMLNYAKEITKAAADAGKDPMTVAGAIQPIIDGAAQTAGISAGKFGGPEAAAAAEARVRSMGQALLMRPASTNVSVVQTGEDAIGGKSFSTLDKASGKLAPIGQTGPNINLTGPGKDVTGVSVTDIPDGAPAVPSSAPVQVAQAPAVAGMTSDAIELRAQQLIDGNENALKGLPRSRAGMAVKIAIENRAAEIAKEKNLSPEEVNALTQQFKATTKGAQILGSRSGNLVGAISIVTATAPIVAELSSKIDRTQFPLINQLIIAGKQQTGDPDVVRLGIALNTVTNGYARAQGGGNNVLTDHAREEARQLLQLAYSDGQLKAGVDQLLIELQREQSKVGDALKDYLKLRKDQIQQSVPQQPPSFITPGGTKFKVLQ